MGRPRKTIRVEKNGDSLKVFDSQGYAGSISLADLALSLRTGRFHPTRVYKETGDLDVKTQNTYG